MEMVLRAHQVLSVQRPSVRLRVGIRVWHVEHCGHMSR